MKGIGWLLAGGAVLYYLYENGYIGTTAVATGTSSTPQGNDNSTSGSTVSSQLGTTWTQVQAMAATDPNFAVTNGVLYGSPYHWIATVSAVIPSVQNVPLAQVFPGTDLTQPMDANTFWNSVKPYLSQTFGLSGMGMIAHHVNPYTQGPRTSPHTMFGAGLAPIGIETYIFRKGAA